MASKHYRLAGGSALLLALMALSCERGPELEPASGAAQPRSMQNAVMANENGVRVIAQVHDWPGPAEITEAVTPIRLIVDNGSGNAVQVRYSDFQITAPNGKVYRVIPPRQVSGSVETDAYVTPMFTYERFYTAPYYGSYYSGVPPYTGTFFMDAPYYGRYYPYWEARALLPTSQMLARALPEGVLAPGGRLDGYLYFQKLELEDGTGVDLQVAFKAAGSDQQIMSANMPFVVD